jgi:hypothetical protein
METKKIFAVLLIFSMIFFSSMASAAVRLYDDFNGNVASSDIWHIPTWVSPNDGTFLGRTQFRCSQSSLLPSSQNSNALITLQSYNPTGFSFYGTDLVSDKSFSIKTGLDIKVRARMIATKPGIVGGIFLYDLKNGSNTLHDEIDFELLTNSPNGVNTNIYDNEPLGVGHPKFVNFSSGTINDFHTYEIKWFPDKVIWYVDGNVVRREKVNVPSGPMHLHLNMWAPGVEWAEAYSPKIQPTSKNSNQVFTMKVAWIDVQPI